MTRIVGVYVGQPGLENFEVGVSAGTWGWPERKPEPGRLRVGDLIVIAQGGAGRVKIEDWVHRTASTIVVGRVTRALYSSDEALWPDEKAGIRRYPFRINFELLARASQVPFIRLPQSVNKLMQISAGKQGRGFLAELTPSEESQVLAWAEDQPASASEAEVSAARTHEPTRTAPEEEHPVPTPTIPRAPEARSTIASPRLDLEWLAERTLWDQSELREILDTLTARRQQVILAGPPGTGKTWVAEAVGTYLTGGRQGAVEVVQFHPSYSYEDFVEGLRPVMKSGQVAFDVVPGVLVKIAEKAGKVDHPVVLVVDEMNRANLPSVFGELLYLLEYRDKPIGLLHREVFRLPKNLYIIGTMNTADRSIRSVDTALRRRFDIFDCPPRPELLDAFYGQSGHKCEVEGLAAGLGKLNAMLAEQVDRHHAVGHTFLMAAQFTRRELERTWQRQIQPLIEEYFFDQPDLAGVFTMHSFWPG